MSHKCVVDLELESLPVGSVPVQVDVERRFTDPVRCQRGASLLALWEHLRPAHPRCHRVLERRVVVKPRERVQVDCVGNTMMVH